MKLKHITFTGIGIDTDIEELKQIQREYPIVEFGVLLSKNWKENGQRYFDPSELYRLRFTGLNLSCHVCGSIARDAIKDKWEPLYELTRGMLGIFNRCQLNVAYEQPTEETPSVRPPLDLNELIIQQRCANRMELFNTIRNRNGMSVLLDPSGGRGIQALMAPPGIIGLKTGYAGGFDHNNVKDKLICLFCNEYVGDFWIDMESSVRTDDKFDLNKVRRILEICTPIIKKYKNYERERA